MLKTEIITIFQCNDILKFYYHVRISDFNLKNVSQINTEFLKRKKMKKQKRC